MFGVGGAKSGAVFMQAYEDYSAQVAQLENNICNYLKVIRIGRESLLAESGSIPAQPDKTFSKLPLRHKSQNYIIT